MHQAIFAGPLSKTKLLLSYIIIIETLLHHGVAVIRLLVGNSWYLLMKEKMAQE